MRKKPGTYRQIVYKRGTNLDDVHLELKVFYEPVGARDLIDGVPDLTRYTDDLRARAAAWLANSRDSLTRNPEVHAGGEVQSSMQMSGPHTFTVMSVIKEIRIYKADNSI
jgi:hypothetical protein